MYLAINFVVAVIFIVINQRIQFEREVNQKFLKMFVRQVDRNDQNVAAQSPLWTEEHRLSKQNRKGSFCSVNSKNQNSFKNYLKQKRRYKNKL